MRNFKLTLSLIVALIVNCDLAAQFSMGGGGLGSRDTSNKKFKLAGFPYINYDRTQEFMFGAVGMGMFRFNQEDTISPKSMVGVMAIGTTTETWGTMGFSALYWKKDLWRAMVFGGYFSFNYQFYWNPVPDYGQFIRYNSGYSMIYGKLARRVTREDSKKKLYAGFHGMYANANTTFQISDSNVKAPTTMLNNVGLNLDYDSRNDVYYPEYGFYCEATWNWYAEWLGNNNAFNNIELAVNNYQRIHKRIVQASRFYTSFGVGQVPFEGQQILGQTDIRGYSEGKQRGDQLFALQTESRIQIFKRWFLVAFAGVGTTGSKIEDYTWDNLWPGAGGGVRFTVMQEEKFNIGLDVAAGRNDWSMTFVMGESF